MIWAVFLLLFASVCAIDADELVLAQFIHRHGSRYPCATYPTDPYWSPANWPGGYGQLTKIGEKQALELGKFFHRRYGPFLGNISYSTDVIYTLSSQLDRTQGTATHVLAGFFPQKPGKKNNRYVVNVIARKTDNLLIHQPACPRYKKEWWNYMNSPTIQKINYKYRNLYYYLEYYSRKPIRTITDVKDLHDTLSTEKYLTNKIPGWAQNKYAEMEKLAHSWMKLITGTTALKRLYSGFLLKEILDHFRAKRKSKSTPKQLIWHYSAHDVTIAGILNTIGVFEPHIPSYTASVLFEFYKSKNGHHYVQVFYRNEKVEKPKPLNIPNCGKKCPLNQLYDILRKVLPSSLMECYVLT